MAALQKNIQEYRKQLEKGAIQSAYRGLMEYILGLRTHFKNTYPAYFVSGMYQGYMDMTYFSFIPDWLKQRQLKIAIVFVYDTFRFEVWLAAANKQVQSQYWNLIKQSGWDQYRLVPTTQGYDSIIEHVLAEDPDFGDLEALTRQIESGTLGFIRDVESFLNGK